MSGEYISREAVLDAQNKSMNLAECRKRLERLPAADVAPVRHGRWLPSDVPGSILDKCSECGFDTGAFTFRYCPACGAKMDLPEPPKEEA